MRVIKPMFFGVQFYFQFSFLKSFFFWGSTSLAKFVVLNLPFLLNKHLDFAALIQTKSSVFGMKKVGMVILLAL